MKAFAPALRVVLAFLLASAWLAPVPVRAAHVSFGEPEALASLGQPVVFQTSLEAATQPEIVEVLVRLPTDRAETVLVADVVPEGGAYRAAAVLEADLAPNTRLQYRFRVRDGRESELGPEAEVLIQDERFEWQTISGPLVRLHWYEGDEGFARRALEIGEGAITRASDLLGVETTEPVDFFIYTNEADFRDALAPGRENVGGQAHSDIRTLFGIIEPFEIESDWVDTLVIHELTHLVFNAATENDYHSPPLWLNEGVAVYLSEGYNASWQATVADAVASDTVIPLDGLTDLFPTSGDRFRLAYGESVSAVDYFIRTHGEQNLWDLVRNYANGVSDDDAFTQATGAGVAQFNEAWMTSLGVDVPDPIGPVPGVPGPLPPGWSVDGSPPPAPSATEPVGGTPGTSATPDVESPRPTPRASGAPQPSAPSNPTESPVAPLLRLVLAGVVVAGIVLAGLYVRSRQEPPN
jgi:hypothetical protein